jgi:hypothetical protein
MSCGVAFFCADSVPEVDILVDHRGSLLGCEGGGIAALVGPQLDRLGFTNQSLAFVRSCRVGRGDESVNGDDGHWCEEYKARWKR